MCNRPKHDKIRTQNEEELEGRECQVMQSGVVAWVVAPPGRLRDAWRALLLATPQIADVRQVASISPDLGELDAPGPDLVLLDVEALGETTWVLLEQIRAKVPHCRCIALVCSARQQREALEAGANVVLIKGFAAAQLSAAVEHLLSRQEGAE